VGLEKGVYAGKDVGEGEEVGEDMWMGCCEGSDVRVKGYQQAPWGIAGGGVGAVDCRYS